MTIAIMRWRPQAWAWLRSSDYDNSLAEAIKLTELEHVEHKKYQ